MPAESSAVQGFPSYRARIPTETHKYVEDPKLSKKDEETAAAEFNQKEKTLGQSNAEWLDVQYGTGKIRIRVEYVENRTWSLSLKDFDLLKNVREGSSGQVLRVMKKDTQRIYAFKTIQMPISFPSPK
jgi:serum/glucocorticoid-regulated kinase 2